MYGEWMNFTYNN